MAAAEQTDVHKQAAEAEPVTLPVAVSRLDAEVTDLLQAVRDGRSVDVYRQADIVRSSIQAVKDLVDAGLASAGRGGRRR